MPKLSKRTRAIQEKIDQNKVYAIDEALTALKECPPVKFDESVDVSVCLGIDARKSDQAVRGSTVLPNGVGRDIRVAVFAQGDNAKRAKSAGADVIGFDDLAKDIEAGNINFDVLIATPDVMATVGRLGQILGPKGLMPNPKVGTVTKDIEEAVKNAKAGQVRYRTDKGGIVHCAIGKLSFSVEALKQNLETLIRDLKKAKPTGVKGVYLRKIFVSSTMGPGLAVDQKAF